MLFLCMYNSQSFGIPEKDGTARYVRIYTKYATQHNLLPWFSHTNRKNSYKMHYQKIATV